MVKGGGKRADKNDKNNKKRKHEDEASVDLDKSITENFQKKVKYWDEVAAKISCHKQEIEKLKKEYEGLTDIPKNRIKRADLRVSIEKYEQKIKRLKRSDNQVEYLTCVAKVFMDEGKPPAQPVRAVSKEPHYVVTSGAYRQRQRIKPVADQKPMSDRDDVCQVVSIKNFVSFKENTKIKQTKMLAELLKETPSDNSDYHLCPICPGVIMEFIDVPPSMTCRLCGLSREVLDVSSTTVHDKDTSVHTPFTYRPKLHFVSWVRRITGQLRFIIPPDITDHVRYNLVVQRGIKDVNKVTWDVVSDVLHDLAKRVHPKFSEYYQHVYQITNNIRGSSILKLTSEQEQELYNMFDVIYDMWENYKQSDRSNFMSNALALQLCFYILDYPEYTISMFNMLKGTENLRTYDRICEKICIDLGKEPIRTSTISNIKAGIKGGNIVKIMKAKREEERAREEERVNNLEEFEQESLMYVKQESEEVRDETFVSPKRKAEDPLEDSEHWKKHKGTAEEENQEKEENPEKEELDGNAEKQEEEYEYEYEWVEEEVDPAESLNHKRKEEALENSEPSKKPRFVVDPSLLLDD
jgi:rubredoxin